MKFTLAWLKDHLETRASADAIVEALTDLGLEVEGVHDPAAKLDAFTVCRVIEAVQHPNADRLRSCRVETWPDGPGKPSQEVQVVCGAPNARTGLIGVFAAPGTYIPGTDMLLKPGEIRGVASNGMLCSERELMISDDHEGIIDLPEDAPLGARYVDYAGLDDPVIEIAVTPNRPDALGVYGVARDLAARGVGRLKDGAVEPVEGAFRCPVRISLDETVTRAGDARDAACPLFVGRQIRGVKNGPSPTWLQRRLRAVGLRPINALVDVTNFLTIDRARPLHVFDADKIEGDVRVRLSKPGESLTALDDKTYEFDDAMTLICDRDGARAEAIGGVMGGLDSGCDEATTNVFIESAYFDPIRTASTGRKLKIHSDARYRFERGVDPEFAAPGAELATRMILDLCGGEASTITRAGKPPKIARKIKLDPSRVENLVGMAIENDEQVRILSALGFTVSAGRGAALSVTSPSWRPDVHGEADLVEEIARIASLTKLTAQPLPRAPAVAKPVLTTLQRRSMQARRALAAAGLCECVTYSFVSEREAALFGGGEAARRVDNPIAADKSDMRPSLLPGLIAAATRNLTRDAKDIALFEIGPEFLGAEPGEQREAAAGLRVGAIAERHWAAARRPVDLYDAKADALTALEAIGAPVDKLMIDREVSGWLHPGRAARLKLGPKLVLAEFGELHPRILRDLDVKAAACAFWISLEAAPEPKARGKTRAPLALHDLQAVERDFAFVVDDRVEAEELLRAARAAEKKLVARARVFDVFDGAQAVQQLGAGKKSVAISVTLQPVETTLTEDEIEAIGARIIEAVRQKTGAELRA